MSIPQGCDYRNAVGLLKRHRRLPHWQPEGAGYFVTWRLAGSLPAAGVADLWTTRGAAFVGGDRLLDSAPSGPRWLTEPKVATVVGRILREGVTDGRYNLAAYVLMPNHIHLLLKPEDTLPRQIGWIKGRTAFEANRVLKRSAGYETAMSARRSSGMWNETRSKPAYVNPLKTG